MFLFYLLNCFAFHNYNIVIICFYCDVMIMYILQYVIVLGHYYNNY